MASNRDRDLKNYPGHRRQFGSKGSVESFTRIDPDAPRPIKGGGGSKPSFNVQSLVSALGGAIKLGSSLSALGGGGQPDIVPTAPPMGLSSQQAAQVRDENLKEATAEATLAQQQQDRALRERMIRGEEAYRAETLRLQKKSFRQESKARKQDLQFKRSAEDRAERQLDMAEEQHTATIERLAPVEDIKQERADLARKRELELSRMERDEQNAPLMFEMAQQEHKAKIRSYNVQAEAALESKNSSIAARERAAIEHGWKEHDRWIGLINAALQMTAAQQDIEKDDLAIKTAEFQLKTLKGNAWFEKMNNAFGIAENMQNLYGGGASNMSENQIAIATLGTLSAQIDELGYSSLLNRMNFKNLTSYPSAQAMMTDMIQQCTDGINLEEASGDPIPENITGYRTIRALVTEAQRPGSTLNPVNDAMFAVKLASASTPEEMEALKQGWIEKRMSDRANLNIATSNAIPDADGYDVGSDRKVDLGRDLEDHPLQGARVVIRPNDAEVGEVTVVVHPGTTEAYALTTVDLQGEPFTVPILDENNKHTKAGLEKAYTTIRKFVLGQKALQKQQQNTKWWRY